MSVASFSGPTMQYESEEEEVLCNQSNGPFTRRKLKLDNEVFGVDEDRHRYVWMGG